MISSPPALLEAQRTPSKKVFFRAGDGTRVKSNAASQQDKQTLNSNVHAIIF